MAAQHVVQLKLQATAASPMDLLDFISSLVHSIAWPLAAVAIAFIFRVQIESLLKRIRGLSWGEAKLDFSEALDKLEDDTNSITRAAAAPGGLPGFFPQQPAQLDQRFNALLALSPSAAILETWKGVEEALQGLAVRHQVSYDPKRPLDLALQLKDQSHLTVATMALIREMRKLRDGAAHHSNLSAADALRFQEMARQVEAVIRLA